MEWNHLYYYYCLQYSVLMYHITSLNYWVHQRFPHHISNSWNNPLLPSLMPCIRRGRMQMSDCKITCSGMNLGKRNTVLSLLIQTNITKEQPLPTIFQACIKTCAAAPTKSFINQISCCKSAEHLYLILRTTTSSFITCFIKHVTLHPTKTNKQVTQTPVLPDLKDSKFKA